MVTPILLHAAPNHWYEWHLHPDVIALCVGLLIAYWYAVTVWRTHLPDAGRVKRRQIGYFVAGVGVIYIAGGSPIHDVSENWLLSVHMTQHLLFSLVAPPLLLAGVPTWLWEALLLRRLVLPVARVVLHPLVTIAFFNSVLVLTHLPEAMNFTLNHHWFHFFIHAVIVSSSLMMWFPIVTNVPGLPRLTYPFQMAYLFVQSLIPSVVGSFITFSRTPVYSFYENAPRLWGLSAVEDQQIGAFVMKVVGSLIIWGFIGVAFFKWYAREEAESKGLALADVETELQQIGLTLSEQRGRYPRR
jgi:putative membrane protein